MVVKVEVLMPNDRFVFIHVWMIFSLCEITIGNFQCCDEVKENNFNVL